MHGTQVARRPVTISVGAGDAGLVARVREGDDRAFEQLYAIHRPRVAAVVGRMVRDHGRVEDLVQDVFVSALRRLRETDGFVAFGPWVAEIARNASIDHLRRAAAAARGLLRRR
jgi:RNA polymerase sigma factor (sigma-70 family)